MANYIAMRTPLLASSKEAPCCRQGWKAPNQNSETSKETIQSTSTCSSTESSALGRLISKEDPLHVHKSLGILCLLSYAWRMSMAGEDDMGFTKYPQFTLPTILLHFLLSATSFVFRIPIKRIKSGGYRIWPEYRWHSLIFLCRSLLYMVIVYGERTFQQPPRYWLNHLVVIASIAAADTASQAQGSHQSPTIRGMEIPRGVQYFFSLAQISATTGVLWGVRRFSQQFIFCWVIQLVRTQTCGSKRKVNDAMAPMVLVFFLCFRFQNAFLMTLRRKNIASHGFLIFIYGSMITIGICLANYDLMFVTQPYTLEGMWCVGYTAVLLRLGPRWKVTRLVQDNKYLLWTSMFLLTQQIQTLLKQIERGEKSEGWYWFIFVYAHLSQLAAVGLGYYKHFYENSNLKKAL